MATKLIILSNQSYSLVNFRYHMICDFLAAGLQVEALAPMDAYFDASQKKLAEIHVPLAAIALCNTGLNPVRDATFLARLFICFRRKKPDIAFFYTIKPVIYGCLAAKLAGIPNVYAMVSGLGYIFSGESYKQRLLRRMVIWLYRLALAHVNKVFFHNQDDADLFVRLGIVKSQQVVVTDGSGVDTEYFTPLPHPPLLTFLFVGRLIRDKGIYEFVAAAKQIKAEYPTSRFLIAGGLHDNPSALSQAALDDLIKDGTVEYLGEVADIRTALQQASVFVLPSYREGLSRAALEALATARPIITTDAPGCREVAPTAENGIKAPVHDVAALVAAMRYFAEQPERIFSMGEKSRELAVTRFSVSTINRTILESMGISTIDTSVCKQPLN